MKLFFLYLKEHKGTILFFIICAVLLSVSFGLYHLPVEAVLYPVFLCLLIGAVILAGDFYRMRGRHRKLEQLWEMRSCMPEDLPEVTGIEEKDYQRLIELLCEEQSAVQTGMTARYNDMMEYYTVWVHQIKTPIAAMRLRLQNEDSLLARQLNADLNRIEQYVEMVMAFLRLDSESSDYVIRNCDLDTIVRQSVRKFAGEFIMRKIRLNYAALHAEVLTDEKWLGFVIEQVISNALKYTLSGSVTIYLEEPKTLCIQDSGIGIAPEDLPRIFEKGYTGYNGRSHKKASGLGLYLCRQICRRLGHEISAESAVEKGTVVKINLQSAELEIE